MGSTNPRAVFAWNQSRSGLHPNWSVQNVSVFHIVNGNQSKRAGLTNNFCFLDRMYNRLVSSGTMAKPPPRIEKGKKASRQKNWSRRAVR